MDVTFLTWPGSRVKFPQLSLVLVLLAGAVHGFGPQASGAEAAVLDGGSAPHYVTNPEEFARIKKAIPSKATVAPKRPRKLLIFCLNVGYGGHPSIAHANQAFAMAGQATGAFQTVVSNDPAIFERDSLRQFDAVFFNNTVGNCFTNAHLRENLAEFVYGGGGLLGVHGTTVAFTRWPGAHEDWPEFGVMIGARGANHRESQEHVVIKLDDPEHPLNRVFGGQSFDYRDEFFRVGEPYSRERVRVLLSIDNERTLAEQGRGFGNVVRPDNDYALAWVRQYGQGRVFYCTIAHNPYVFWDPKMLQFYVDAIQFALGDLDAPTLPSARLTPAVRAQEKLRWHLGLSSGIAAQTTLFDAMDQARKLGLLYVNASSGQMVSRDIQKPFAPGLITDELRQIRMSLDAAGLRMPSCHVLSWPSEAAARERWFEFGRAMGIGIFVTDMPPGGLEQLDQLGQKYGIKIAFRMDSQSAPAAPWQGRGPQVGVCLTVNSPAVLVADKIRSLGQRLFMVELGPEFGNASASMQTLLGEMQRLKLQPLSLSLSAELASRPQAPQTLAALQQCILNLPLP
jgi:type 1 glutamine amidotransferase